MKKIAQTCEEVQGDCLTRIRHLRQWLDGIERRVKDDNGSINDLGEMQGVAVILDCRLASLSVLRRLRKEAEDSDEQGMRQVSEITLLYVCPDCGMKSEQELSSLVQNGTHTCDCGVDMVLEDEVKIEKDLDISSGSGTVRK